MTPRDIIRLLNQTGLKPQTAAGQHFLLDETVAAAMIDAAQVKPGDIVLEIGPGFGVLTAPLIETGARVIGVELDQRLAAWLSHRFRAQKNFTLVTGDIFQTDLRQHVTDGAYKLVANLPYSATNLVFRNFLTIPPRPVSLTVMIQAEVADRVSAAPGRMSVLSVMAQYYATVRRLMDVPKTSFYPIPGVDSAVVHLDVSRKLGPDDKKFLRTVKLGFSARRKQIRNTLAAGFKTKPQEIEAILNAIGIAPTLRPQDLAIEDWRKITKKFV